MSSKFLCFFERRQENYGKSRTTDTTGTTRESNKFFLTCARESFPAWIISGKLKFSSFPAFFNAIAGETLAFFQPINCGIKCYDFRSFLSRIWTRFVDSLQRTTCRRYCMFFFCRICTYKTPKSLS